MTMNSTSRDQILDAYHEIGPYNGERLVEYSIFLTDAFGYGPVGAISYMAGVYDDAASPSVIDGFENDDSYRATRHLARRKLTRFESVNQQLRESSLARQLMEKRDQPATIRLIRRRKQGDGLLDPYSGQNVPWVNIIPPNTKFFLERVTESREEKVQVVDTFGEWIAFFFGRRPEVYNYSGTLLNAKNHDWKNEFQENYENFLRGSQAVKHRATMFMQYDDVVVEGYMLNCQITQNAMSDKGVPFSFNLLVINRSPISPTNLLAMRLARSTLTDAEQQLFQDMSKALSLKDSAGKTDEKKLQDVETFLLMREFFSGNYMPPSGMASHYPSTGSISGQNSVAPKDKIGNTPVTQQHASFQATATSSVQDPYEVSKITKTPVTEGQSSVPGGRISATK